MKKILLIIFLQISQFAFIYAQSTLPQISTSALMKTVEHLSSWQFRGRLAGSEGYNKAADFMADEFKRINLKQVIRGSYFQDFYVEYNEILAPVYFNLLYDDTLVKKFRLGDDYVFRGFTGSGKIKAPVAFCGYGMSRPENGYDDYAGMDVRNKVVIAFKYPPHWKIGDSVAWKKGSIRDKAKTAFSHGALGIIFVSLPKDAKPQKTILSTLDGEGEQNNNFPMLHLDISAADLCLDGSGFKLKDLQSMIDSTKNPFSLIVKTVAEIEVHNKYFKEQETKNVIAMIEGSDPKLKNEYMIIGAHLDHVGSQAEQIYAPGANDNASGSAAVLAIADAISKMEVKPKRSIIFVLFSAEELGLNGAKHFVNNPPVPLEKITAMFNLDCIGYGDSIEIGNGKSAPNLWNLINEIDSTASNMMVNNTWNGGGADATPFHEKGIPCAYFVTTNSYEHLHYITDKPGTLNKVLFTQIVQLAFNAANKICNGEYEREDIKIQ